MRSGAHADFSESGQFRKTHDAPLRDCPQRRIDSRNLERRACAAVAYSFAAAAPLT
jgi:hypothetical protein